MERKYYILENGTVSQPYSIIDLRTKIITSNSLVCVKFGNWKEAKYIPEIAELIDWKPVLPDIKKMPAYQESHFNKTSANKSKLHFTESNEDKLQLKIQQILDVIKQNKYLFALALFTSFFLYLIIFRLASLLAFASNTLGLTVTLIIIGIYIWIVLNYILLLLKK